MITVLSCIAYEHNPWLILVAVLLCGSGSWVSARLFQRALVTKGLQRTGWYFLTALSAGVAIWCTHFVAILGFKAGVPIDFDPSITVASLLVAVGGSTIGFILAGDRQRIMPIAGGAIIGLAISAMHYMGMAAYRVQGIIEWNTGYLIASVVLAVVLSAAAMHFSVRPKRHSANIMAGLLSLAIVSLHFTGMAAFQITPLAIEGNFSDSESYQALAMAVAGMAVLIVAAGLASYLIDDSARAESIERLRKMALNDTLTGLPNRPNYNERLEHEMELARAQNGKIALIGIDLNRFKEINDTRGHNAGDEVLRVLGRRLRRLLEEEKGEFAARVGGDEFAAIYRLDEGGKAGLILFLERLNTALSKPIRVHDFHVTPGASLGIAIYPDDAPDKETLINNADLAMYRAKADLTSTICFYEAGMDETLKARRCMAADLREALANNQLSIHYQVQTSFSTGEISGYEALLRWNHPLHGFIPPCEFIPVAEQNGLILPLGEWVLRTACETAAKWHPPHKVAVNISAVQFSNNDLPKVIMQILLDTGLRPEQLELELTESAIFKDKDRALHMLRQIKALGVSIALDDFGTGYSSLDTLRSFAFDRIKIDRSFVNEAMSDPQTLAIIQAVLALGKRLNIPVLAEGIETEEQLSMLTSEGCNEGQGFLLGRPAAIEDIIQGQSSDLTNDEGGRARGNEKNHHATRP